MLSYVEGKPIEMAGRTFPRPKIGNSEVLPIMADLLQILESLIMMLC
jgi:hypothetical protein